MVRQNKNIQTLPETVSDPLWFERVLALRPMVDLAGAIDGENLDAGFRERIAEAFNAADLKGYFAEVERFIRYCFEEIILKTYLRLDEEIFHGLVGIATFYSRVPTVFEDFQRASDYVVSSLGFGDSSTIKKLFGFSHSPVVDWFCQGNRCDEPCFDKELRVTCGRAVLAKALLRERYAFIPFFNSLPSRFSLSLKLTELSTDLPGFDKVFRTLMAAREKLLAQYKSLNVPLAAIASKPGRQFNGGLASLFSSLEEKDQKLLDLAAQYVIDSWQKIFGFNNPDFSLFDFESSFPEFASHFSKNREWLANNDQLLLSDFLGMVAPFLLVPGAKHLHCFHFGLGHEEELPAKVDGASGVMVLYDCMRKNLTREQFYGIQFLMQSCMSSLAILESELIQAYLVVEKKVAENAQFILRKLHHALAGPISVAFNRYALRHEKMQQLLGQAENSERDLEALDGVYAILKSARGQVASWTAFSNPEGIQDRREEIKADLRQNVEFALSLLFNKESSRPEVHITPHSPWPIEGNLDMGLIDVLLWQLLKNAQEYFDLQSSEMAPLPEENHLRIRFEQDAGFWTFDISNTAPGFSARDAEKINDGIIQGKACSSSKTNGQGLGLLTCHEIAVFHQGEFQVAAFDNMFCASLKIPCTSIGGMDEDRSGC